MSDKVSKNKKPKLVVTHTPPAKKPIEYDVYMTYTEDREGGGVAEGEEGKSYPNREDEHITFEPTGLFTQTSDWVQAIQVKFDPSKYIGQPIFVVIARYSDGDTFGQTQGNWSVVGAYAECDEADSVVKNIETGKYKGYKPWDGYFAGLEGIEVHEFLLGERPSKTKNYTRHY